MRRRDPAAAEEAARAEAAAWHACGALCCGASAQSASHFLTVFFPLSFSVRSAVALLQVRLRRWQAGLSAGGVAAGPDALAAAAAASAALGAGGSAAGDASLRYSASSGSFSALGAAAGSSSFHGGAYVPSDDESDDVAGGTHLPRGGPASSSSSSSLVQAQMQMPPAQLAAAAAAAAARCAVSARDLALCLDMVSDVSAPGGAGSPGASDVGLMGTTGSARSVPGDTGGTPGGGAGGGSLARARSSAAEAFAHMDAMFRPSSSSLSAAGAGGDDDDDDGATDDADTHGLSPLAAAASAGLHHGGLSPGARRTGALRQRTFRMSDLASDDATMDAATAAALAPSARAAAAAAAAAALLDDAAHPRHHHVSLGRHLFPRISSSTAAARDGGGGGGGHHRRRRSSISATVRHYRVAIPARVAAFQSRPGPRATTAALDGVTWQVVMLVCTLYVLFAEDIKVICFPPSTDAAFRGLAIFNFAIFVAELLVRSVVEPDYAFRFYFWLDAGAALSLLPDFVEQSDSLAYGRAGRAARVGARLGRVIRFVRVVQTLRLLALVEMRRARARRAAAAQRREEEAAAAALGLSLSAFQRAAAQSRRPGDGTKSAHADDLEDWPELGAPTGTGGVRSSASSDAGALSASATDIETGAVTTAPPRRTSTPRSAAVEARLAAGTGGRRAGLDRASAVWERMNALMSRKLIIGLLAVIIIFPLLEVVRSDFSPQLFLHTLESWPYGSGGFNATLDAFIEFGNGVGSTHDGTTSRVPHPIVYIAACDARSGSSANVSAPALPLSALQHDACGGAWSTLLSIPGPGARGASLDPASGLRRNELFRVVSDSANSAVWYDIRAERVLVRDTRQSARALRAVCMCASADADADADVLLCFVVFRVCVRSVRRRPSTTSGSRCALLLSLRLGPRARMACIHRSLISHRIALHFLRPIRLAWLVCCSFGRTRSQKTHTASSSTCVRAVHACLCARVSSHLFAHPCLAPSARAAHRQDGVAHQHAGRKPAAVRTHAHTHTRALSKTPSLLHALIPHSFLIFHPPLLHSQQRFGGDAHDNAQR
jgi:hypothetical protein